MSSGLKQELEKYKRYIAIHEIARVLGHDICCLLPAFHAIAGCDSVSSFHGIGKKSGFSGPRNFSHKLLELKEFGANAILPLDHDFVIAATRFICTLNINKILWIQMISDLSCSHKGICLERSYHHR